MAMETPSTAGNERRKPYLSIRNVTKKFGDFTALNNISLVVFESEFVCFLGPSGCGKTTLLRAVAGLDIQTAGWVEQAATCRALFRPTALILEPTTKTRRRSSHWRFW